MHFRVLGDALAPRALSLMQQTSTVLFELAGTAASCAGAILTSSLRRSAAART
jgi:hypothetical protein